MEHYYYYGRMALLTLFDNNRDCGEQRRAWTGLDILQDTCDFFGSGLDLFIDFWKNLDQDRIRIFAWFV